jgi:hypothetical protein
MTTAVKVDAHAGWPVLVVTLVGEPGYPQSAQSHIVEPLTEQTFYIHSGLKIVSVSEQPLPKKEA